MAALARVEALGLRAHASHQDPIVRVLVGETTLAAVRAALGEAPATAFVWRSGARDDRFGGEEGRAAHGVSPSVDPIDALIAVGVASPAHGIGTAALVRFVTTLRGVTRALSVDVLSEDTLGLSLTPRSPEAALRIAARARELCAPLAARRDDETLAREIAEAGSLTLSWR